jgi:tRNA G18 (ribose-2'-O)-methylase SpoU
VHAEVEQNHQNRIMLPGYQLEDVQSLEDPRLNAYRSLRTTNYARDAGIFVAEGTTVVERVLRSDFRVRSLLISERKWRWFQEEYLPANSHFAENHPELIVFLIAHALAEQLAGFVFHSGVMAEAYRRPAPDLNSLLSTSDNSTPSLVIAGDRIVDPENVGALIRIAAAFGASAVILGPGSADPFSRRVLRVSMGNVLFLPVLTSASLPDTLTELQSHLHYQVCSTVLNLNAIPLQNHSFSPRSVLVFGNEYDGIDEAVQNLSDVLLTIPMLNGTDSLNVAVSAGISAFQFRSRYPHETA